MYAVLLVLHVILAVALIIVVLLQKSEGGGLGIGGGGGGNPLAGMTTGRGAANFLTRLTSILAFFFMANCLLLAVLSTDVRQTDSIASKLTQTADQIEQKAPEPVVPPIE